MSYRLGTCFGYVWLGVAGVVRIDVRDIHVKACFSLQGPSRSCIMRWNGRSSRDRNFENTFRLPPYFQPLHPFLPSTNRIHVLVYRRV